MTKVPFRVPVRFQIFSQTITVTSNITDFIEFSDRVALASYRTNEIQINPMLSYKNQDMIEQSFFHELVHFIMYHSNGALQNKDEIWRDENFVDLSANLLHQALTTMEYE